MKLSQHDLQLLDEAAVRRLPDATLRHLSLNLLEETGPGHAVDVVIYDDVGHVDVPAAGMVVVAANGGAVTFTNHEENSHLGPGHPRS